MSYLALGILTGCFIPDCPKVDHTFFQGYDMVKRHELYTFSKQTDANVWLQYLKVLHFEGYWTMHLMYPLQCCILKLNGIYLCSREQRLFLLSALFVYLDSSCETPCSTSYGRLTAIITFFSFMHLPFGP